MLITKKQIENLDYTSCISFLNDQFDRFEIYESKQGNTDYSLSKTIQKERRNWVIKTFPDSECVMKFYDNRLEALLAFNHYSKTHKTLLLWDMAENPEPQWAITIRDKALVKRYK